MNAGSMTYDAYSVFALVNTVILWRLCVAAWGACILVLFIKQFKISARLFVSGVVILLVWAGFGWINSLIPHAPEGAMPTIGDGFRWIVMLSEIIVGLAASVVPYLIVRKKGCAPTVMLIVMSVLGLGFPLLLSVAIFLAFKAKPKGDDFDNFKSDVTRKGEEI